MQRVFAVKNTEIKGSSSGGAFPTLIEVIRKTEKNLVVYGAAFDEDFHVVHIRATEEKERKNLRGSKYVQSKLGQTFSMVLEDLKEGRAVLFSGTPCQVAGLRQIVKKNSIDDSHLYLIDIICHGTPNPKIWEDYKTWLEERHDSPLKAFSFRYQKAKWKEYPMMAAFQNGETIINTYDLRIYNTLFFTHLTMMPRCYSCKYSNMDRPSDLTLGDFWHVQDMVLGFPYKEGASLVLANSRKGEELMEFLEKNSPKYGTVQECFSDAFLKYQHNLNEPTPKPSNTDRFWEDYKKRSFEEILRKYAGYGWKGKVKHGLKKFLAHSGLLGMIRKIQDR